jgi:hypothetical protein
MTLFAALLAAQALSAPTLAEIERLSPEKAGERLQRDRPHERVVSAGRKNERSRLD